MNCIACNQDKGFNDFYFRKDTNKYSNTCKRCCIDGKRKKRSTTHKKCKHCGEEKPFSEYQKAGGGKWLQPYCKPCDYERKKKHTILNIESVKEKKKTYYIENKHKIAERGKKRRKLKNVNKPPRIYPKMSEEERKRRKSIFDKIYRENNYEKVKKKKKEYYNKFGLEKAKEWQRRKSTDIEFKTKKRLRGRIYVALKRGIKSESTMTLLGCTIEFFRQHFQSKFTEGMTWGKYMDGEIVIDHIKPCAAFDLTNPEDQKRCFHYSNLQPLWELDNLRKGKRYGDTEISGYQC